MSYTENTTDGMSEKIKRMARDIWGYDCAMCGTKSQTDLAHQPLEGENPYHNTKPLQLVPLCRSCHAKSDKLHWESPFHRTLRWVVRKKADMVQAELEEYLDEHLEEINRNHRSPLGNEEEVVKRMMDFDGFNKLIEDYYEEDE